MSHLFRALSAARTHSLSAVIGSFDYLWLVWLTKITTGLIPPKFVSRELQHFLILLQLDTPSSYNSSNGRMSRYSARQGLHYSRTFWAIVSLPSSLQDANRDASSLAGQLTCRCSRRDDIPPQRFRCTRLSQFVLCLYRWKNACKGRQFGVLPRNCPKRSTVPPMSSSSRKLEVTASAVMQACKCSLRCFQVCWQYIESLSTARDHRPRAVLKTEGTVFPNTDRARPANNVLMFVFRRVLCKQFLCGIFSAAIFKPGVRMGLTFRK